MKQFIFYLPSAVCLLLVAGCFSYHLSGKETKDKASDNVIKKNQAVSPTPDTFDRQSLKDAPSRFGLAIDFTRKDAVPAEIWKGIVESEENVDLKTQLLEANNAVSWVWGSQIDLNNDDQPDYVVMARTPPLAGANITTFWVFLSTAKQFRLVLKTSALQVDISDRRKNELKTISGTACTAVKCSQVDFQYDGKYYQPVSHRSIARE